MTESPECTQLDVVVRSRSLRLLPAAVTAAFAAAGLFAGVAGAKTQTLHFYQVSGPTQFYNASGDPINLNPPATLPTAGDSFDETDLDYAGTAKHHSSHWTASDHLTCTFTNADTGRCDSQIAIGGSMLLSNNFTYHFQRSNPIVAISEGTGAFHGVHGWFTDMNLPSSNNAILAIHLS
jgi:hypothetical protein